MGIKMKGPGKKSSGDLKPKKRSVKDFNMNDKSMQTGDQIRSQKTAARMLTQASPGTTSGNSYIDSQYHGLSVAPNNDVNAAESSRGDQTGVVTTSNNPNHGKAQIATQKANVSARRKKIEPVASATYRKGTSGIKMKSKAK